MKRQILEKNQCTGCSACKASCPQKAIYMEPDAEGFTYPVIDEKKCIDCNICVSVCNKRLGFGQKRRHTYIAKSKDNKIREISSSGGLFPILALEYLNKGGHVFGAAFNETLELEHIGIHKEIELKKLQKSKYVQSDIKNTYQLTKELLSKEEQVLYSGTPCQIAGLKAFLQKDYENLLCVDIICQGVPSPIVWKKYLEFLGEDGDKIKEFDFRSKKNGWNIPSISYRYESGKEINKTYEEDCYMEGFAQTEILRMVCYDCPFRGELGYSDFTLGDCWGYEQIVGYKDDDKGTSVVILNTKKAEKIYKEIQGQLEEEREIKTELLKKYNKNLYYDPSFSSKRLDFFRMFSIGNYKQAFWNLKNKDRRELYLNILSMWLDSKLEKEEKIVDYFNIRGYKNIAIYGMGILGKVLWKEISSQDAITVACCIDNNPDQVKEISVINSEHLDAEIFKNVDLIVVTPIHVKTSITNMLSRHFQGDIMSIDEIFQEVLL